MVVVDGVVLASFYNSMKIFGAICWKHEASGTDNLNLQNDLLFSGYCPHIPVAVSHC